MKYSENELNKERVDELLGALAKLASRGMGSVAKTGAKASSSLGKFGAKADAKRKAKLDKKKNLKDRAGLAKEAKKKEKAGTLDTDTAVDIKTKRKKLARERLAAKGIQLKSDKKNPNRVKKGDLGGAKREFDSETMTTKNTPARTAGEKFRVAMRQRKAKRRLTMSTEVSGTSIAEEKKKRVLTKDEAETMENAAKARLARAKGKDPSKEDIEKRAQSAITTRDTIGQTQQNIETKEKRKRRKKSEISPEGQKKKGVQRGDAESKVDPKAVAKGLSQVTRAAKETIRGPHRRSEVFGTQDPSREKPATKAPASQDTKTPDETGSVAVSLGPRKATTNLKRIMKVMKGREKGWGKRAKQKNKPESKLDKPRFKADPETEKEMADMRAKAKKKAKAGLRKRYGSRLTARLQQIKQTGSDVISKEAEKENKKDD